MTEAPSDKKSAAKIEKKSLLPNCKQKRAMLWLTLSFEKYSSQRRIRYAKKRETKSDRIIAPMMASTWYQNEL